MLTRLSFLAAVFAVSPAHAQSESQPTPAAAGPTFFRAVRVFDSRIARGPQNVLIKNGRIEAVAPDLQPPASAEIVDGAGRTLLPGLIDCHTHTFTPEMLQQALVFGVTTELDMF